MADLSAAQHRERQEAARARWSRAKAAGAPLSDAEHKQRRDAAHARWAGLKAAGAAAGAAAGVAAARAATERLVPRLVRPWAESTARARASEIQQAATSLADILVRRRKAAATLATLARQASIGRAFTAKAETESPRSLSPVSQRVRLIRRTLLQTAPEIDRLRDRLQQNEQDWTLSGKEERALRQRAAHLASQDEPLRMELEHLKTARPPKRDDRAGSTPQRRTESWTVTRKPKGKNTAFERAKPVVVEVSPKPGLVWQVKPHRARVSQGDISAKGLKRIREALKDHAQRVHLKVSAHATAMRPRIAERKASALAVRYTNAIARRLGGRARLVAAGAGALAGGLAGLVGVNVVERRMDKIAGGHVDYFDLLEAKEDRHGLAKAEDTTGDLPDSSEHLSNAVDKAEPALAQAIAKIFGQWKGDATANLLTPREATLYSTMLTDLDRATRPLEPVLRAGADAPIPAHVPDDEGGHKVVTVTMGARGPDVADYLANYRQDRITALANDQRAAIRDLLIDAAHEGASPDEMARRIRQTIGLTGPQGQAVLNYRQDLEQGDAGALTRVLRDKRYDKTVQAAQADGRKLTDTQIDRMVDAYHRRALASRAMTIARTEGVGAANNAHVAVVRAILARNPGYTVIKGWNAKIDKRTRHDHRELHGQSVVGIDTPFTCADGEQIRWPHDPRASAKQVINCRCFPSLRIVPRALAAKMGTDAVRPFSEEIGDGKG